MKNNRENCPCCGYPTLPLREHIKIPTFSVCELCDWEDEGQNEKDAEKVYGGANQEYSLNEAKKNFKKYGIMYNPKNDFRIKVDSIEEKIIKKRLIENFGKYNIEKSDENKKIIWDKILNLEKKLSEIKWNGILKV